MNSNYSLNGGVFGRTLHWIATKRLAWAAAGWLLVLPGGVAVEVKPPTEAERCVLVELFTSQGCNLCPEAEELLGSIADRSRRVVPIAFHVDYFNDPWPDPYSDAVHSARQMAYHNTYPGPKPAEYGLYYTPMLMVDGAYSVNGRERPAAESAMRLALQRPPAVTLRPWLRLTESPAAGELKVRVSSRLPLAEGRKLVIGAVLRDDGVTNRVLSGENEGKTLIARFPARKLLLDFVTLTRGIEQTVAFKFPLADDWPTNRLRVAVFAQDHQSGIVHQALDLPWRNSVAATNAPSAVPTQAPSTSSSATGVKPAAKEAPVEPPKSAARP
jgi:hypothetical protein